ncbi:CaiB/BaiF CoA transferase family protein [Yinghuangia seranimata]|uniref:CaiB/BaiF CoA transferase family protein n=1 Tax=Yinghuangia seranimata TaxID=408067 RepID=UPI00248AC48E|nr:CoA transferase [Yinghuangia seranimata]MDI2129885.1 CoA transferase [Yinghuangia seranimata]
MRARGGFVERDGVLRPAVPYRMSHAATRPPATAPQPGADTAEFLSGARQDDGAAEAERLRGEARPDAPLAGLRVFDLTSYWAGPYASQILAWLGADVVKVESARRPDGTRVGSAYTTAADRPWERAPLFHAVNTGKRGVTIDLTHPEGVLLARRLLDVCDILVENYSPRVVERFGLLPADGERPDLITARMPAWGLTGPWRDQPGFAQNMEQATGLAYITGHPDGPPVVPRGVCDPLGGWHAAFAVLAAVWLRRRGGPGQLIEAPLLDAALNVTAAQVLDWSAHGILAGRHGNRSPSAAPQGLYPCGPDGALLALSVEDDAQWRALTSVLGAPPWPDAHELSTAEARHRAHDRVDAWLTEILASYDRTPLVLKLLSHGVPAAALTPAERALDHEQLTHRRFATTANHPVTGPVSVPGFPAPWPLTSHTEVPAPLLGQHNDDVFAGLLGLSTEELAKLADSGVVGTHPL